MGFLVVSLAAMLVSAIVCIWAKYYGPLIMLYVAKPLTTLCVVATAVIAHGHHGDTYRWLIIAGLCLSLLGDVFLMLPHDGFVPGLLSFLIAHVLFTVAFVTEAGFGVHLWILLALALPSGVVLSRLFPYLGKLKVPVFVYVAAIVIMAWQGWERWFSTREVGALAAAIGTLLFLVSDSTLALNKFRNPFRSAEVIVLSTYFVSIWLIATSLAW